MEPKINSKLYLRTLFHFVNLFFKSSPIIVIILICLLSIGSLSSIVNIYLFKYIIDTLGTLDRLSWLSVFILLIYGGLQTVWVYIQELTDLLKTKIKDSVSIILQKEFMWKLETIPYRIFEDDKMLDIIGTIKTWIDWEPTSQLLPYIAEVIPLIVKIIITSVVIINLGIIPIFILILFSIPQFIISNRIDDIYFTITDSRSPVVRIYQYLSYLNIDIESKKEIRLYSSFSRLWEKIQKIMIEFEKINWKNSIFKFWMTNLGETLQISGQLIVIYFFIIHSQIELSLGNVILQISFVSLFTGSVINLLQKISAIRGCLLTFSKYIELLDIPSEKRGSNIDEIKFDSLEFQNVSFKYDKSDKYVFENLNFSFKKGDKIAIVGLNGSGKTTMIKILLRFYEPTSGKILFNGIDISTIDLKTYLKEFSAIFQDFTKYSFTVRENIEFGNPDHFDEEFYDKAKFLADSNEIIDSLESKDYQLLTKTFDGGTDLSVGQWQRIALARMYYRNSEILILDEPTSAIDAIAEAKIFKRIQEVSRDKTIIIISHRFSTVREADRIIVLNEGKIIEDGNHEKLLSENGLYAEMFNAQAEGYK